MNLQTGEEIKIWGMPYAVRVEMPDGDIPKLYARMREEGIRASTVLSRARTIARFRAEDESENVRLVYADDLEGSHALEWLDQTAEQIGMSKGQWEAIGKRERARAESDGVFGLLGQYRTDPSEEWEDGDSVWGFIGSDGLDAGGYAADIMAQTLEILDKARAECCRTCKRPKVGT